MLFKIEEEPKIKLIKNNTDIFKIPRHHFEAHWPENHVNYFARGNKENN